MKKNLEIITYTHKGVSIAAKVDYNKKNVSLVHKNMHGTYIPQVFVFNEKGLEYMDGWHDTFDAMKYAIDKATILLKGDGEHASHIYDIPIYVDKVTTELAWADRIAEMEKYAVEHSNEYIANQCRQSPPTPRHQAHKPID